MSTEKQNPQRVNEAGNTAGSEFLWGAKAMAPEIGRTPRQVYHLLARGLIKSSRKVGHSHVAHRGALRKEFGAS